MRALALVAALIAVGLLADPVRAQNSAQERAASLRAQLVEVEAKQTELQTRLQQLDEQLKAENIERSLAGVGSVHPEELRAARRRQLEIERRGVQSQLEVLSASRSRLETAVAAADAESYRQSAGPAANVTPAINNGTASKQTRSARQTHKKRRLTKRH